MSLRTGVAIGILGFLACAAPPAFEKQAPLLEGMGDTHLAVSTESALAQRYFDQGLVLAFGFNHAEAGRSFREARRLDPELAMAYWGEALVLGPNINAAMDDANVPRAHEAAALASHKAAASEQTTPLERALIAALEARYVAAPLADRAPLDAAYAAAMRDVSEMFPGDPHVHVLYAEALMDTMPWDYWLPDGTPKPSLERVLAALERAVALEPDHPGANHLWIHAVEAVRPADAEPAADRLGALVPGAGHLVHMPSHIYIRVGRYRDASEANERAILSDSDYVAQCHAQGLYPLAYVPHNHHFLWYAAAMEGRSHRALEAARHVNANVDPEIMRQPGYGTLQHFFSLPLFTLVRFGRWDAILEEPMPDADLVYPLGVWHYARGMALAQGERIVEAEQHQEILGLLIEDPRLDGVTIWDINETRHILQLAHASLAAELAVKHGDSAASLARLREAVVLEDSLRYDEPPPWHAPVRQRLGELLLLLGRAAEAETVFREDLAKYPENGWSLAGLARALEEQGQHNESARVRERFRRAWARADVELSSGGR